MMAFNRDHIKGNLWDRANSATLAAINTYSTFNGILSLRLGPVLDEVKAHFGCSLSQFYLEGELSDKQIYWEKRYNFYDVMSHFLVILVTQEGESDLFGCS